MSRTVYHAALIFLDKCRNLDERLVGRRATQEEIDLLANKFGNLIPGWYFKLISDLPLINMEIAWQAYEPEENYDGLEVIKICCPQFMMDESFGSFPGIPILNKGYVCVGIDPAGSGNPYFINFNSDNPSLYQIYHDVGDEAEVILEHGRVLVADTLSNFFRNGKI